MDKSNLSVSRLLALFDGSVRTSLEYVVVIAVAGYCDSFNINHFPYLQIAIKSSIITDKPCLVPIGIVNWKNQQIIFVVVVGVDLIAIAVVEANVVDECIICSVLVVFGVLL